LRNLVEAFDQQLSEVRITDVRDGVFFATLVFDSGVEVEARPSDSIALALRTGSRIVCAEDVLASSGINVPDEEEDEVEKFRAFLDDITPEDFESGR
jgi:bifunctional DNase/RNase